jgi:uncharacterized protein (DUF885 family)
VTDTETSSTIDDIAIRYWDAYLRLTPTVATMYGDERYADRLPDPGPAGRAAERALAEETRDELAAIPEADLSVEDRITRGMLEIIADLVIREDELSFHELRAVDQIAGPQTLLSQIAAFQPADTPARLEAFLDRLRAYGPFMDAYIGIMRAAKASGRTPPRIVAERTIDQLHRMLAIPLDQAVIAGAVRVAAEADRERVREVVRDVVYPADRAYLEVLEHELLPATRESPGLHSAPDGRTLYAHAIRAWTTLELDPLDVHRIGLDELDALNEERREIARAEGFGDDLHAYRRALANDPANQAATPEALVARAARQIEEATAVAGTVFGRLPRATCEVRPVEAFKEQDSPFAYYFPPTADGSRGGVYYVNTYDLPSRTFDKLAATTFHEAVPGHHFQISLEMEHPTLNVFRRLGSRLIGSAFAEGWGLYAERLADELGLYRTPGERFGMLDAQAWRAARMVVDSGLHALGWSRQQAIDFLLDTGLSSTDAAIETDRYIAWPGQALAYMVGMREIRRLRRELEARDGDRFDLKRFHDETIGHGSLPLATLAAELPRWLPPSG